MFLFLKTMMSSWKRFGTRIYANDNCPDLSIIFDRLILAGGPPRSGTTLLARILNAHDHIATAVDNSAYESWGLYYYRFRAGLCARLRVEQMDNIQIRQHIIDYLYKDGFVLGISRSRKVADCPEARQRPNPVLGNGFLSSQTSGATCHDPLGRRDVPYTRFQSDLRLCLKSPEISFFLEILARAFPAAQFVLVFRPVIEIAESMYRKGFEWKLSSYHKRWANEKDQWGHLIAPPGVPGGWSDLWQTASDFQRCVIYATSYLRALVQGLNELSRERWFLYYYPLLVESPEEVLAAMARFLKEDPRGFLSYDSIHLFKHDMTPELVDQYEEISGDLEIGKWESRAHALTFANL